MCSLQTLTADSSFGMFFYAGNAKKGNVDVDVALKRCTQHDVTHWILGSITIPVNGGSRRCVCVCVCVCDKHSQMIKDIQTVGGGVISSSASPVQCCCEWPVSSLQTWWAETPDSYSGIFLMRIHKFPKKRYKAHSHTLSQKKKKNTHTCPVIVSSDTHPANDAVYAAREGERDREPSQPAWLSPPYHHNDFLMESCLIYAQILHAGICKYGQSSSTML